MKTVVVALIIFFGLSFIWIARYQIHPEKFIIGERRNTINGIYKLDRWTGKVTIIYETDIKIE